MKLNVSITIFFWELIIQVAEGSHARTECGNWQRRQFRRGSVFLNTSFSCVLRCKIKEFKLQLNNFIRWSVGIDWITWQDEVWELIEYSNKVIWEKVMPTHPAHQQNEQHHEQPWWGIGQVISKIPGWGFRHFKFQTPEEGRPGGSAKIKGILTLIQPQIKAAESNWWNNEWCNRSL